MQKFGSESRNLYDDKGLNPVPPSSGIVLYFRPTRDECSLVIENRTPKDYTVHKEDIGIKSVRFLREYPDKDVWYDVKLRNVFDGIRLLPGSSYRIPFKQVCPQPATSATQVIYFVRILDEPDRSPATMTKDQFSKLKPHALGDGVKVSINGSNTEYEVDMRRFICVVDQYPDVTERILHLLSRYYIGTTVDRGLRDETLISPVDKFRALKILRSDPDIMKSKIWLHP